MKINSTEGRNEWKCWLNPDEAKAFKEVAKKRSQKHYCTVLLGLEVGLRAAEIPQIKPLNVRRSTEGKYLLRVEKGKDTTGQMGGKSRDAYLADHVERALYELEVREEIENDEPYLNVSSTRVRQRVKEVAEDIACRIEEGENRPGMPADWRKLSSHDLRRYWAQDCLRRQDMDAQVVMSVGGWSSFDKMKPYLLEPTEANIISEFETKF
jgi:integrase